MAAAATVTQVSGQVFVIRDGVETPLHNGDELAVTDGVRTGLDGKAAFQFADGTEVALGNMSAVELREFAYEPGAPANEQSFALHMMEGLVRTVSGEVVKLNPEGFTLSTPLGTAGIRGTTIVAHIFPTHVVFMVTDMSDGHLVFLQSFFGESMTIFQAGKGGIISLSDISRIIPLDAMPEETRDVVLQLLQDAERSSHEDIFLLYGDEGLLASLGATPLGRSLGLLEGPQAEVIFKMLAEFGVSNSDIYLHDDSWPTVYWTGTPNDDVWAGAVNQHHYARALSGNDSVAVFNGNDTVFGGNGSHDFIVKITPEMHDGTFIHGGELDLSGVTLDPDTIIVRAQGKTIDSLTAANGYFSTNSQDYGAASMTGGVIYGSAETLEDCTGTGNSIMIYGEMSGGVIYGSGGRITGGSFSGNSISIEQALDASGAMAGGVLTGGGVIFGDGGELSGVTAGSDTFILTGMSGGAIYGDGGLLADSTAGSDTFKIGFMSGGAIYGDGGLLTNSAAGNDAFFIENLSGGTIYGDAPFIDGTAPYGSNSYEITTASGGTIVAAGPSDSVSVSNLDGELTINNLVGRVEIENWNEGGVLSVEGLNGTLAASNGANGKINVASVFSATVIDGGSTESDIWIGTLQTSASLDLNDSLHKTVTVDAASDGSILYGGTDNTVTINSASGGLTLHGNNITLTNQNGDLTTDADNLTITNQNGNLTITDTGNNINITNYLGGDITTGGANAVSIGSARGAGTFDSGGAGGELRISTLEGGALTAAADESFNVDTVKSGSLTGTGDANSFTVSTSMQGGALSGMDGSDVFSIAALEGGNVYGYAESVAVSGNTEFAGDEISVTGNMSGGAIYGDAQNVVFATPSMVMMGQDTISLGDMSGGAVYGDVWSFSGSGSDEEQYLADNTISIAGTISGAAAVYGNAGSITGDAWVTVAPGHAGCDEITVAASGGMSGGTIYGDAGTFDTMLVERSLNYAQFCDSISVEATSGMSGGAIYGDAGTITAIALSGGASVSYGLMNDDISVSGPLSGGAAVYGDAHGIDSITAGVLQGSGTLSASSFMQDEILVGGADASGKIYGDAQHIDHINISGGPISGVVGIYLNNALSDNIHVNGNFSGQLYGDAEIIGAISATADIAGGGLVSTTLAGMMADNIFLGSDGAGADVNLSGASIYGDARTLGSMHFSDISLGMGGGLHQFMADQITVYGNVNDSVIYGDAESVTGGIDILTLNGLSSFTDASGFMGDTIAVYGELGSGGVIYGDFASSPTSWNINFQANPSGWVTYDGLNDSGMVPFDSIFGCDSITVGSLNGGTIDSGFGNDTVEISALEGTHNVINLGGGDDYLHIETLHGSVNIINGAGSDSVHIDGLEGAGNAVSLGSGEYHMTIDDVAAAATGTGLTLTCGEGKDVLQLNDMSGSTGYFATITIANFNSAEGDAVLLNSAAFGSATVIEDGPSGGDYHYTLEMSSGAHLAFVLSGVDHFAPVPITVAP